MSLCHPIASWPFGKRATNYRALLAKEPLKEPYLLQKIPYKDKHPMSLRHPVARWMCCSLLQSVAECFKVRSIVKFILHLVASYPFENFWRVTAAVALFKSQEILKSQLDIQLTILNDYSTDFWDRLQQTATDCNRLQRTATDCNRLQQTATDCNRLQQSATVCNT